MSWDFGGSAPRGSGGWGDVPGPAPAAPPSGTSGFTGAGFDSPTPLGSVPGAQHAPWVWLLLSLLSALGGLALRLGDDWRLSAAGWACGGPLAIGLLAAFVTLDTRRRSDPWYAVAPALPWVQRLTVLVALVAVGLNAWIIADAVARGGIG